MKTKIFIVCVAVACITGVATMTCANQSNARSMNVAVGDTLTLNLYDTTYTNWTDTLPGPGGYWNETYNDNINTIQFEQFVFSHLPAGPGASFSGSYWDGFTTGSNGDNNNYGFNSIDSSGSVNWINHQWGVMAGGGITNTATTPPTVQKGLPYLIAYWGYHMEPEWWHMHFGNIPPEPMHNLTVHLEDNSLFAPQEVYICNHPWPYYGNINGDGFARPLNQSGDRFDLIIHAIKWDGREDSIIHNLAIFEDSLQQSPNWISVDLTALFDFENDSIQTLYFTMYTTDADPYWGPNTAVYFNLDKLKVIKQDGTANTVVTRQTKAPLATAPKSVEIIDYFPLTSYTGGEVIVYDAKGKEVLKTTVKAGEKVNLSKLPKGEYCLQHGHRIISITKR